MKLHLSVVHTAQPGSPPREFEFSVGPVAVGRSAVGQVLIEGPSISRVHVSFETVHGAWHVTHEGSAAPSFLNGAQLPKGRPTRIAHGDRVVVGSHEMIVALPEVGESIPGIEPLRDSFVSRLEAEEPNAAAPLPPSIFSAPQAPAFPFPAAPAPAPARPGPAGRVVPTLVAVRGAPETSRLEFSDTSKHYVIGRSATCDLTLDDTSISRQHAFARFDGSRVFVRDAQARSPVRVNDRPIVGETPLSHGDVVSVGPVDLKFLCETDPVAAPEPEDSDRATFIPKDERTQVVQRGGNSGESAPPAADVPWQPAALDPAPAFPAAAPAASHVAPAPWDRAAQPAPAAPSWEAAAAVPPPVAPRRESPPPRRTPPPAPAPTPAPAQDWAAISERAAAPPRQVAPPAWETPRVASAPALPPSPVHWDVPSIPDPAGAAPWAGPPPVAIPSAPQIQSPPMPDIFTAPPMPQMPPAPQIQLPPPPPPAAAAQAPQAAGGEPRVVTRRSSSQRGWLIAGVICMVVAVVTGTIFILAKK